MKIPGSLSGVARIYGGQQAKVERMNKNEAGDRDRAEISEDGREIRELLARAAELPETRKELVDKLKSSINDGSYVVDFEQLADKILETLEDNKDA